MGGEDRIETVRVVRGSDENGEWEVAVMGATNPEGSKPGVGLVVMEEAGPWFSLESTPLLALAMLDRAEAQQPGIVAQAVEKAGELNLGASLRGRGALAVALAEECAQEVASMGATVKAPIVMEVSDPRAAPLVRQRLTQLGYSRADVVVQWHNAQPAQPDNATFDAHQRRLMARALEMGPSDPDEPWPDCDLPSWSVIETAIHDLRMRRAQELQAGAYSGVARIAQERRRQVSEEGCTAANDDTYKEGELAAAAAAYATPAHLRERPEPKIWPWPLPWWKPGDRLRELEKAGALIAAEIDRLQRKAVVDDIPF